MPLGSWAMSVYCSKTLSPFSTAMILSSASPPSIRQKPPIGLAFRIMSPRGMWCSDRTRMSSGSLSPSLTVLPDFADAKSAMPLPQYVRGMKP